MYVILILVILFAVDASISRPINGNGSIEQPKQDLRCLEDPVPNQGRSLVNCMEKLSYAFQEERSLATMEIKPSTETKRDMIMNNIDEKRKGKKNKRKQKSWHHVNKEELLKELQRHSLVGKFSSYHSSVLELLQ